MDALARHRVLALAGVITPRVEYRDVEELDDFEEFEEVDEDIDEDEDEDEDDEDLEDDADEEDDEEEELDDEADEVEPARSAADRDREFRFLSLPELRMRQSDNTGSGGSGTQDQSKHPHVASGPKGGQFTSTGGGGSKAAPKAVQKSPPKVKAAPTPSVPQAPTTARTMKPGDSGEDVRYAQYAMSLLGFRVDQNGSYDGQTAAAVKEIQSRLGMAKPNGHLSAAQLHKLQDAVRLSPCVGQSRSFGQDLGETRDLDDVEARHRELVMLGIPVLPLPRDDDNTIDDETRSILDALDEWVERQLDEDWDERARDVSKELRIPGGKGGGRWTANPISTAIAHALEDWGKGKGPDDPFVFDGKPIDREPLRKAAVARGITLKRGASRDDIVKALLGGVKDEVVAARTERQKRRSGAKFSIDVGGKVDAKAAREVEIQNDIRSAYAKLKGRTDLPKSDRVYGNKDVSLHDAFREQGKVFLADLRDALGDKYSREEIDKALTDLAVHDPSVRISPVHASQVLTEPDRAAALKMGGENHHLLEIGDTTPRPMPRPVGGKRVDVAVYTGADPNAPTLREITSANRPGRTITSQPDLAGLEKWANDNGHTDVAQWAASERARVEAKNAPKAPAKKAATKAAKAAPKAPSQPKLTAADRAQAAKVANAFHEDWRKTRLQPDGSFEPRVKTTTDKAWIAKHGTDQVDIANSTYADLPADWKAENKAAAEVVQGILKAHGGTVDLNDEKTRLAVGEEIHQAWLSRNDWAKSGELDVPFADLPRSEQDKDTDQLKVAMSALAPTKKAASTKRAASGPRNKTTKDGIPIGPQDRTTSAGPGKLVLLSGREHQMQPGDRLTPSPQRWGKNRYSVNLETADGRDLHVEQDMTYDQAVTRVAELNNHLGRGPGAAATPAKATKAAAKKATPSAPHPDGLDSLKGPRLKSYAAEFLDSTSGMSDEQLRAALRAQGVGSPEVERAKRIAEAAAAPKVETPKVKAGPTLAEAQLDNRILGLYQSWHIQGRPDRKGNSLPLDLLRKRLGDVSPEEFDAAIQRLTAHGAEVTPNGIHVTNMDSVALPARDWPKLSSNPAERMAQIQDRVEQTYRELATRRGEFADYVSVADVRDRVGPDVSPAEFDRAVIEMSRRADVKVVPESNQKMLPDRQRQGAVSIGNQDRHLILISEPPAGGARPKGEGRAAELTAARHAPLSADPAVREVQIENRIRAAYNERPEGTRFVGLADLRDRIGPDVPRAEVDAALTRMTRQPGVGVRPADMGNTYPWTAPKAGPLTQRDHDAALMLGGTPRHMIDFSDPAGGLTVAEADAYKAPLRPLPGATSRADQVTAARHTSDVVAEVHELVGNGATPAAIRHRLSVESQRTGVDTTHLQTLADDPKALQAAADKMAEDAGLRRVGDVGAKPVPFDRKAHTLVGPEIDAGSSVKVVRPSHVATLSSGEQVSMGPAKVRAVTSPSGRPPAKPVAIHDLFTADNATVETALRDVFEGQFGPYTTKATVRVIRAGTRTDGRGRERVVEPSISIEGKIYDAQGHEIGDFGRSISQTESHYADGTVHREIWARHSIVQMGSDDDPNPTLYHGKGFGGEFNRRAIEWYRASGVHGITQNDHNGYVWASQGFDFSGGGKVPDHLAENMRQLIADLRAGKTKSDATKDEYHTIPKAFRESPDLDNQIAAAEALLARAESIQPGQPGYPTAYEISQLGRREGQRGKTAVWLGKLLFVSADEMILNPNEGEVISP